ncbi:hypothetical protein [Reichenbachiella sp.]|uniref:hypothetical protein n=1 Tax=Reichenbachiella sp. TaxID=2184521 RepID=UPI003BB13FC3
MKSLFLISVSIAIICSCQQKNKKLTADDLVEDSFKEQKDKGGLPEFTEHFDSLTNLYSNFKYRVAFDAPDHWQSDMGVSEHNIFRAYQADSAISFSINVIELKTNDTTEIDIWESYQKNKEQMDYPYNVLLPKQLNTELENYVVSKSYLRNRISLKRSFNYMVRELDFEYENTSIVYQTNSGNYIYTFGLDIPTMFYVVDPDFYNNLFLNISFSLDKNELLK